MASDSDLENPFSSSTWSPSDSSTTRLQPEPAPTYPQFPKFPTLMQLVEAPPALPARRKKGLFEDMLQARPEILLQDAHKNPQSYDQDAYEILYRMHEGKKKFQELTQQEQQALDEATMEYFSATPRQRAPAAPISPSSGYRAAPETAATPTPIEAPSVDAFWWTR